MRNVIIQTARTGGASIPPRWPVRARRLAGRARALLAARSGRHARGQALVELALVTPVLLLLFAGAGDLGRAFYGYIAIENAAKEGALYGARDPLCATSSSLCPNPDNVLWRFQQEIGPNLRNADGGAVVPSVSCTSPGGTVRADLRQCIAGDTYRVEASYTFAALTPVLAAILDGDLTVGTSSTAVVMNEAFDPSPGIAAMKLVDATTARNAAEVASKCTEPDPTESAGFYRSPCKDVDNNDVFISFRKGDAITYKLIVRNNGGTNLSGVTVVDSLGWPAGCLSAPTSLVVGSTPYACTYSRTAPTPPGGGATGEYPNVVTVDAAETTPATDTAIVALELAPADLRLYRWVSQYKEGDDGDGVPNFGSLPSLSIFRTSTVSPTVWFKIIVTNVGDQAATAITLADSVKTTLPYGQNSTTAVCDAKPASLAPGARFECRYISSAYTSNSTTTSTTSAASPDDTTTVNNSATATMTVALCSGTNKLAPRLIGLTKAAAQTAWTKAGFQSSKMTSWSGTS
ncbi:MAG: TadE/TadG family type IV pilus assembly protein, partial [Candidatus Limnocylindrales bacterium]